MKKHENGRCIVKFFEKVKEQGFSFTIAMVYAICKCANEIEAFRYRFLNGKVVLYDQIDTAFTYMNPETELFKVVNVPMKDDIAEYVELASRAAKEQKDYFTGPLGNDEFQCYPMPWVTYTHISHTNSGNKDNATPLFDWGKYYEKDNKIIVPVSVQAHHSFVDEFHAGQAEMDDWFDTYWKNQLSNSDLTEKDIKLWKERRKLDRECSVETEMEMLCTAKFKTVKCVYSYHKFSVIVAIK